MENFTTIVFLLAVLLGLYPLIDRLRLPHPVFLVLIGLLIGLIPFFPHPVPDPQIIFLVVLPPLLFDAATQTSWLEFKTNFIQISTLGISLVFFTMMAVAVTAHYAIPHLGWPLAFLLGAIVSPPDAVASGGIIRGLGLNKKVISILEGESLINDASALIAYRYALVASVTGSFVFWKAGLQFLWMAGGGIGIGFLVGHLLVLLHRRIDNFPVVETGLSLLTPFLSYLASEQLHTSGILAVVSTGMVISWHSQEIFSYRSRLQIRGVWDTLIFLMNGFVFILIGLQLPGILKELPGYSFPKLVLYGLVVSASTILVRILWVFASASASTLLKTLRRPSQKVPAESGNGNFWKNVLVVSWTGTRGLISMATALALPLTLYNGAPFVQRNLIIFLCFVVIFVTLVVQGLSLPLLIRWLKIEKTEHPESEIKQLQLSLLQSTLDFIENDHTEIPQAVKMKLARKYQREVLLLNEELESRPGKIDAASVLLEEESAVQRGLTAITEFQRTVLAEIRKSGAFSDSAVREVEQDMDIDELKRTQSES